MSALQLSITRPMGQCHSGNSVTCPTGQCGLSESRLLTLTASFPLPGQASVLRNLLPWSLCGEPGPADISIPDFQAAHDRINFSGLRPHNRWPSVCERVSSRTAANTVPEPADTLVPAIKGCRIYTEPAHILTHTYFLSRLQVIHNTMQILCQ